MFSCVLVGDNDHDVIFSSATSYISDNVCVKYGNKSSSPSISRTPTNPMGLVGGDDG